MPTAQGDLSLLNDPVAQKLLQAPVPAQLAYTWTDGSPRVLPIGFHWDGQHFIIGTAPQSPKMTAFADGTKVALTINTYDFPFNVLYVRGTISVSHSDDIIPEYFLMARRMLGEAGAEGWLAQVKAMLPAMGGMERIAVTPTWVGILDFEQRFPSAIERAVATAGAA
jgi:hypothetical protein